jgi:hypothetical protein
MKKLTIAFTLIIASTLLANAQQDTLKSRDGDWGFVLNLTGLIENISLGNVTDGNNNNFILAKHHLTDDKVLRLGLGIKSVSDNWLLEDSIALSSGNRALQTIDSTESRFDFSISVGFEKHLGSVRRLDPFVGGELLIGRIGGTKINASTDITDVTGTEKIQQITQIDGGFNFGLNFIAGFNYFFAERISIGAEINLGYLFSSAGGDLSDSRVTTPVSGAEVTSFSSSKNKSSSRGFNINSTGGLMLSFFF